MESYWIFLALVFCNVGTGLCGAIDQPDPNDPDEADTFFEEFHDLKGRQFLYMAHVDELMKTMTDMTERLSYLEGSQSDSDTDSASDESGESAGLGAVYVRWGRTDCREGTTLVYAGYAGGSWHEHTGAAANYLCLTTEPTWAKYTDKEEGHGAFVLGAEYYFSQYPNWNNLHKQDVPCAVCRAPRSSTMMVPGTDLCLDGWTLEYGGYLTAGHHGNKAASEFVCLDSDPKALDGGDAHHLGKLFFFAEAKCGSLRCPKYHKGRELTCAVCTR